MKLTLLVIVIIVLSLLYITDRAAQSTILGAYPMKHQLLKATKSSRLILLGGSNVSFGIDSRQIVSTLKKPVVNLGVHGGVGLEFMINDLKEFIKKGDTIILIPEYEHFYTDNFYGEMELISLVMDIEPELKGKIGFNQWLHLLKYIPTYAAKKIKNYIPSLIQNKQQEITIYHKNSFNVYGDAYLHWSMPNQTYLPANKNSGKEEVNQKVILFIKEFKKYVYRKKATLLIFPPVIDKTSFDNQKIIINKITTDLKNNDIAFFCEPRNYKYDEELFFNSYYHLNKTGVNKRTKQLINDLLILKCE